MTMPPLYNPEMETLSREELRALQLEKLGIPVDISLANVRAWIARLSSRPSIGSVLKLVA